jgi:hypothetical protein
VSNKIHGKHISIHENHAGFSGVSFGFLFHVPEHTGMSGDMGWVKSIIFMRSPMNHFNTSKLILKRLINRIA